LAPGARARRPGQERPRRDDRSGPASTSTSAA
jgi:hypothetical protein